MPIAKVLIIADDKQTVKSVKTSLEKLDYSLCGNTNNTTEALSLTEELKPDLILIDTKLNEYEDGIEAARLLTDKYEIPHVFISSDTDEKTIERSKTTRPYGYLLKPVNARDLNSCLRMALFRYESEKKLRESEDRYFRLAENARDMIFRMSLINGAYDYVNHACLEVTGYTTREFYNSPGLMQKIVHSTWKDKYNENIAGLLKGNSPHSFEFKIISKNGEPRWLNQKNVIVRNNENVPIILEGIVTDITEQKRYEKLLKDQREEYKLIFEAIPAMVLVKDCNNVILRVNSLGASYLGYKVSDMEGKNLKDFFPAEFEKYNDEDREVIKNGKPLIGVIEEYINNDNEKHILKFDKFPYYDSNNNIAGVIVMAQDITQQIETEQKLKDVELKNSVLINTIPDLLFEFDNKGRYLDYRAAKPEDLFKKPEEFLGKIVTEVLPAAVSGDYLDCIKKAIGKNETQVFEYKLNLGVEKDFEARFVKSGENRAIAITRDITEEKSIETVLRENEKKFRSLYQNAPIAVSRLNLKNNKYEFVNKEFERISGYKLVEYNNLTINEKREMIFQDDREIAANQYRQWAQGSYSGVKKLEYRITNREKQIIWLDNYLYVETNRKGDKNFLIEFALDVTERKNADARIKESEERYRTFIEQSSEGIFRVEFKEPFPVDISIDEQLNMLEHNSYIAESNEQFAKMYGLSSSREVVGDWTSKNVMIKDNKSINLRKKFIANNYSLIEEETEEKDIDGNTRYFLINANGVVENKRLIRIWCIQWDITSRKIAENALKQSLSEKEILLKEIHHRVKNNLQIVTSLLKLQSKYVSDEKAIELLMESQNRVQSMSLIHQKLYQTRDFSHIDLNEYIQTVTMHLQHSFGILEDRVKIHVEARGIIMSIDNAIPSGLIINELVSNSLKYAFPDGKKGEIHILTAFDKFNGDYWLTVRDNGIGIPKDLDITKSNSYGLSLVNLLVGQMGGSLEVYLSGGTEFRINFKSSDYLKRA